MWVLSRKPELRFIDIENQGRLDNQQSAVAAIFLSYIFITKLDSIRD
jgi:hypothetical protein